VLSYNDNNDIIGFCDGYIDNLLHIYETDLKIHYPELNLESLSESIKNKLSVDSVEKILFFSSM